MLSQCERERYKRQMMLFGDEGQERLKKANIFIAGAGGLGSPVSIYLAVAGVGTLTVVDKDVV
jgi:molybdopterin-synthase adenylyltransferase